MNKNKACLTDIRSESINSVVACIALDAILKTPLGLGTRIVVVLPTRV